MVSCRMPGCDNCDPEEEFICGGCGRIQWRRFSEEEDDVLECYYCEHDLNDD